MAEPLVWGALLGVALLGMVLVLWRRRSSAIVFDLTVDHPIFYPNRPSAKRLLVVRLHLSRAAMLDVDVYDEFNRLVARLVQGRKPGAGAHFQFWDGRDGSGKPLPGGSYLVQGTARTALNGTTSGVWVRLDASPARLPAQTQTTDAPQRFETWADEGQIVETQSSS